MLPGSDTTALLSAIIFVVLSTLYCVPFWSSAISLACFCLEFFCFFYIVNLNLGITKAFTIHHAFLSALLTPVIVIPIAGVISLSLHWILSRLDLTDLLDILTVTGAGVIGLTGNQVTAGLVVIPGIACGFGVTSFILVRRYKRVPTIQRDGILALALATGWGLYFAELLSVRTVARLQCIYFMDCVNELKVHENATRSPSDLLLAVLASKMGHGGSHSLGFSLFGHWAVTMLCMSLLTRRTMKHSSIQMIVVLAEVEVTVLGWANAVAMVVSKYILGRTTSVVIPMATINGFLQVGLFLWAVGWLRSMEHLQETHENRDEEGLTRAYSLL